MERNAALPVPEEGRPGTGGRPRFILRPWCEGDAGDLVAAWADSEVRRWTAVPQPADLKAAVRWIAGWDDRRRYHLALDLVAADPDDDRVLGEVGLSSFDDDRLAARIGWWTAPGERGRGLATAMVAALTNWAHNGPLGLRAVVAEVDEANSASLAVARKAGYRPVGSPDRITAGRPTLLLASRVPAAGDGASGEEPGG